MSANDSVTVPVTLTNALIDRLVTLAVRLNRSSVDVAREAFERGLDVIESYRPTLDQQHIVKAGGLTRLHLDVDVDDGQ